MGFEWETWRQDALNWGRCCYGPELMHRTMRWEVLGGATLMKTRIINCHLPHSFSLFLCCSSSHQQLFCTQQPLYLAVPISSLNFNHHCFSIKHCWKSRQGEREKERRCVREIRSTAVPWPPDLSGCTMGIIYSKVYFFPSRQNENKPNADEVRK